MTVTPIRPTRERDRQSIIEHREFVQQEERRRRDHEDHVEYAQYVEQVESEQRRCAPAQRIEPLTFEEWRTFIPEELKDAPAAVRGTAATNKALWRVLSRSVKAEVESGVLEDQKLSQLGFDIRKRPTQQNFELEFTPFSLGALFEKLRKRDSRFVPTLHVQPVCEFLVRNRLMFGGNHPDLAFNILWNFGIIGPTVEPESQPEGANQFGVELRVEHDPAVEARKRREAYGTKIVATGPDGHQYTQFQLDRLPADEVLRVLRYNEGC